MQVVDDAVEEDGFATAETFVEEAVRTWENRKLDRLIEAASGIEVVRRSIQAGR